MPPRKPRPTDTQKLESDSYAQLDRMRRAARGAGDVSVSPSRAAADATGTAAVASVKAGARPIATPIASRARIAMPRGRSRR